MTDRRERTSLMVSKLDRDKATALLHEVLRKDYPNSDLSNVVAMDLVLVNTKKGYATVCGEGVGWWADKESGLYTLPYYHHLNGGYVEVPLDELMECLSGEQTDLATHIRVFGDRLESNFDLWYGYARGHQQDLLVS